MAEHLRWPEQNPVTVQHDGGQTPLQISGDLLERTT